MSRDRDRIVYSPNRREVLIKGLAGALAVAGFWSRSGIVFAGTPGVTEGETPGLEEGPFWVDGQVERVDVRSDSVTGVYQAGTPLYLGLTVSQLSDTAPYTIAPLVGARVDIWNANAQGVYSDEASESTTGTDYQRGYQITNAHGSIKFLTNYSGWYSGRTQHVHFRIRTYDTSGNVTYNYATQVFFDETITDAVYAANSAYDRTTTQDTTNTDDRVLNGASESGSPETEAGDYTMLTLADDGTHVQGSFHIVIDLSDTANADPTGGTETGSGGGGGTGGGPGGGPGGAGSGQTNSAVGTGGSGAEGTTETSTGSSVSTTSKERATVSAKAAKAKATAEAKAAKAKAVAEAKAAKAKNNRKK